MLLQRAERVGESAVSKLENSKLTEPARVLVVDDHPLMRQGFGQLIDRQHDLQMCGEASNINEALAQVRQMNPDLIVIDISLKDGNGLELIKQLKSQNGELKMIAVSMHDEALFAERALHAGALGYVNKEESPDVLLEAIRQVLRGKIFLSGCMTDRILSRAAGNNHGLQESPLASLSDRELEVFELIGKGFSTRHIAEKLHLSSKTVDTYRQNIKTKLKLQSAAELTIRAAQWTMGD